jgi:glycosyltransferase involved in cell wall biosynthesis
MKIAIVHDWLVTAAGSERVLEQIVSLYPQADIYSLVDFLPEQERSIVLHKVVKTSFLQKLPFAKKYYRNYILFSPMAIELFDVSGYDLVISSSHAVAKGVLTNSNQLHICYCHTPMRYAWDLHHQYLKDAGLEKGLKGKIAKMIFHYIRIWDVTTTNRVDYFIANSHYIAKRIKKIYGRDAAVIYPPIDVDKFELSSRKEDYYLTASRMVPYKKIDMIVEAFSNMPDKRLVVIGNGPDFKKVKAKAGKNIELLGYQPVDVLKDYMQRAKAFVFAAEEDFGIVPVEAQACGTPVIAYGRGGVLETVIPLPERENTDTRVRSIEQDSEKLPTGILFHEQTSESLKKAVRMFEKKQDSFDYTLIRKNAERFSQDRFKKEFKDFVDSAISDEL